MRPPTPVRKGVKSLPAQRGVEHVELVQLEGRRFEEYLAMVEQHNPEKALKLAVDWYAGGTEPW